MKKELKPALFGLSNSNRDFSASGEWGKNKFNSSFPASLCCFLHSIKEKAVQLVVRKGKISQEEVPFDELFGIDPLDPNAFYSFESIFTPFEKFVIGPLPRTDLVVRNQKTDKALSSFEIKLTALPDNTTSGHKEEDYGSELVVRPDTIVYLACSLAQTLGDLLPDFFKEYPRIQDWSNATEVSPHLDHILKTLNSITELADSDQRPFLLQPIWKTMGKSPILADSCLDVFVWSDVAFVKLIYQISNMDLRDAKITRQTRTSIWLFKMLSDIARGEKINHQSIIDKLSYNTKNDKAFAISGLITNPIMKGKRLEKPILKKSQIKEIILGGGQSFLSPERRFDAVIYFTSDELF